MLFRSLDYDDGQEQKEAKDDIKHSYVMLEKAEKKTSQDFLSPERDLEQKEKDLVIESSNKTTSSCEFNADNLNVFAGCVEDKPSLGIVSSKVECYLAKYNEEENCQASYDEECLFDEDQVEFLQQKEFTSSLFNEGSKFI